ncbi:MAG: radical SAM protein [Candidatus Kaelpia imicola]|nr:radical SAM protein [Candidatus Kaelpia imicola]
MHISFINPTLGNDYSAMDIAITYLASYVNKKSEHSASIIDLTFHKRHWREYLKTKIEKHKPDLIGFSSNTMYMQYVKTVMEEIKEHYNLPIMVGGHHASIYPEETINIPECDAVYIGDGEIPLLNYLNRVRDNEEPYNTEGIWFKREDQIIRNGGGSFNENLDALPYPDWDLWEDLDRYFYFLGMLYIIGSRGCPYRCSYCDAHGISDAVGGNYFRMRNPKDYAQEMLYHWNKYKNRNLRLLQLFDPVFTIDRTWLEEFCYNYRKLGLAKEIKFSSFARIDNLDEDRLKILAKSGCALLRVGIETGNEYIRSNIYKKPVSNKKITEIAKLCKEYNIALTAFYILGGPGETKKTIKDTIRFADKIKAERSAFFIYKPFTRESIEQIYSLGGKIDKRRWKKANNITFGAAIYTKELTPKEIEHYQKLAYFITFGKRLLSMIRKQGLKYFLHLSIYIYKGLIKNGLNIAYLLIYYHIYGYDNVDK